MDNKNDPRLFQIDKCIELLLKATHSGENAQYLNGVLKWLLDVKNGMEEQINAEKEKVGKKVSKKKSVKKKR